MRIFTEFLELVGAITASLALSMVAIIGLVAAVCVLTAGGCVYWFRKRRFGARNRHMEDRSEEYH
jgi:lipopolysaccharide/colanic/teichoic acid biosynthesis glycosyltransferase